MRRLLEEEYPEDIIRHCSVYRKAHAFEQDLNKEKEGVLEYLTQSAKKYSGTLSGTYIISHKISHNFNFTNSKDANEFISKCNESSIKVHLSRATIEKMVHIKLILNSTEIRLFRERYKIFENEYEIEKRKIHQVYKTLLKIVLPFPKSLEGEQSHVKIRIEPVAPLEDLKTFVEVAAQIRNRLYEISKGFEMESLSKHKLYPLIFTQAFGKKNFAR